MQETKDRIEVAAVRLFAARGLAGTAVRDIAQAAGVADGALYRHFNSKESLWRELFLENYTRLGRRMAARAADKVGLAARLDAVIAEAYRLFDEDRALFTFILLSQHEHLDEVADGEDTPVEVIQRLIAEAMDAGEVARGDTDEAAALVIGAMLQPAVFTVYDRLQPPLSVRVPRVSAACQRCLGLAPLEYVENADTERDGDAA